MRTTSSTVVSPEATRIAPARRKGRMPLFIAWRRNVGEPSPPHMAADLLDDLLSILGALAALTLPLLTPLFVAFTLFFAFRIKKRRARKFKGLRILR